MKKQNVIYPMIDLLREKRIDVSTERLSYGKSEYYFSPRFKLSSEIIDGVVRGYKSKKRRFELVSGPDLIINVDFKKKKVDKQIKEFLGKLKSKDKVNVAYLDVLGYFQNGKYIVLLTSEFLYSDYGRDDYKGDGKDPNGFYVKTKLKYTSIENKKKVISDSNEEYEFKCKFTDDFIGLFEELKELNKTVKLPSSVHPLNREKREVREKYLAILVDKTLNDGNLSANEVVRLEIIARQIGIDSKTVINLIESASSLYDNYKEEEEEFIGCSLGKMSFIAHDYYYMLFHDLITFELLSNKGEVSAQLSSYTSAFVDNYGIEKEFSKAYMESMQKLVISSYSLRDTLKNKGGLINDQQALENLCELVEYEYNLQKELLQ